MKFWAELGADRTELGADRAELGGRQGRTKTERQTITRCYKIKKEYVIAYLKYRNVFPESYFAPTGWYSSSYP